MAAAIGDDRTKATAPMWHKNFWRSMAHYKLPMLEETGYAVLDMYGDPIDPQEWLSLEYVDWKVRRRHPLRATNSLRRNRVQRLLALRPAQARQRMACGSTARSRKAPTLVKRAGIRSQRRPLPRHRTAAELLRRRPVQLHEDDNNRLNPDGEGWVVRCFMNLTDDKDTYMVLREDINDPSTEVRINLPAGAQLPGGLPSDCGTPCGTTATSRATA